MLPFTTKNKPLNAEESIQNGRCIFDYLTTVLGWTPNAACGLLGNTYCESKNNPGAWQGYHEGNTDGGYGIVQWTKADKYLDWAKAKGYDPTGMEGQLQRLAYEVAAGVQFYKTAKYPLSFKQFVVSTESPEYLAEVFVYNYERPASPNVALRRNKAAEYFQLFTTKQEEAKDSPMFEKEQKLIEWAKSKCGPSKDKPVCGYVWGSGGEVLTVKGLDQLYNRNPTHVNKNIVKKWIGMQVFDCATFVREGMEAIGIPFTAGASTSWNKASHWVIKGPIANMPMAHACILYREKPDSNPMGHTGLHIGAGKSINAYGSTSGVIEMDPDDYPWTHYGIPVGLYTAEELKIVLAGIVNTPAVPEKLIGKVRVLSTKWLNVRAGKSTDSADLGDLKGGETIDYYADDGTWLTIKFKDRYAYIMKKFTDDIEDEPETGVRDEESTIGFPKTMTVTADKAPLNVRTGPGTKYEAVFTLGYGSKVTVLEISGTWAKIQVTGGVERWCSAKYLV
jgi:uncharacterized protein YraI